MGGYHWIMKQLIILPNFCLATNYQRWSCNNSLRHYLWSQNISVLTGYFLRIFYNSTPTDSSTCSSFLIPPPIASRTGSVSWCKLTNPPYSIIFFSASLTIKYLTNISTKLIQGIIIVFNIYLLSKIGKYVQMQSMQSMEQLLNLDYVEMIRSTSQMKRRIITQIQALNACFRSDFFLFSMLTTVQITKKKPEPMIVERIKLGTLKAQAQSTVEYPKESQDNLRAGCVRTCKIQLNSSNYCSTTFGFQEYYLSKNFLLASPQSFSSAILNLLGAPIFSQRLGSLKNIKVP